MCVCVCVPERALQAVALDAVTLGSSVSAQTAEWIYGSWEHSHQSPAIRDIITLNCTVRDATAVCLEPG